MLLLEDIHWADDESLHAVVPLVDQLGSSPLLIVCLARPAFAERDPDWGAGPGRSELIELRALTSDDATTLVGEIL